MDLERLECTAEVVARWRKMEGPVLTCVLETFGSCSTSIVSFICITHKGLHSIEVPPVWEKPVALWRMT